MIRVRRRTLIFASVAILVFICLCGGIWGISGGFTLLAEIGNPSLQVANGFMGALQQQRYAAAFSYVHPDYFNQFGGSSSGFSVLMQKVGYDDLASYASLSISQTNKQDVISVMFQVKLRGEWRHMQVNLMPKGKNFYVIGFGVVDQR